MTDLKQMLALMRPQLKPGAFVFLTVDTAIPDGLHPIMTFAEDEALTVVVPEHEADAADLRYESTFAWISLSVHGDLEGVGLTAAFSRSLADAGISCNVVAAFYHDHLFVPTRAAAAAMTVLDALAAENR